MKKCRVVKKKGDGEQQKINIFAQNYQNICMNVEVHMIQIMMIYTQKHFRNF